VADLPNLSPYVADSVLSADPFYTSYKARSTDKPGFKYIITEFNPSFMVTRTPMGALEATARFVMEFESALEKFTNYCELFEKLNEPFIAPIEEILYLNNTVYVVRQTDRHRDLNESLGNNPMDFSEAYVFMRPLIQNLVHANKHSQLLFQMLPGDIRMDPYGQLILDSMFAWEGNHFDTITELAKLFYRLVSGVPYNAGVTIPAVEDLRLPQRLTATIQEVLSGDATYGSIDDFAKHLRTIMNAEGNMDIIADRSRQKDDEVVEEEVVVSKGAVAKVVALVVGLLVFVIGAPIAFFTFFNQDADEGEEPIAGSSAYYATTQPGGTTGSTVSGNEGAGSDSFEGEGAGGATGAQFVRLHTGYAITDPFDPTVMLNGSFFERNGHVYHRIYQNGHGLAHRAPNGSTTVLVEGIRPAFIVLHGDFIYFADGLENYAIRRVRADGSGLETIVEHTASFLQVDRNMLYYTNHSNRDFLYRINLDTMQNERILNIPAYEPLIAGRRLYFINGHSGFNLYSFELDSDDAIIPERFAEGNIDNLRWNMGNIYFRDMNTKRVEQRWILGPTIDFEFPLREDGTPFQVESFDIEGTLMVFIEAGSNPEVWFYNLSNQQLQRAGVVASYVYAVPGGAFMVYYNDSRVIRRIEPVVIAAPSPPTVQEINEPFDEEMPYDEIIDDELET